MTTLDDVAKKKQADASAEAQAAAELVRLAQEQGLSLTGPDGLLKQLTKTVLETALNEESNRQEPVVGLGRVGFPRSTRPSKELGNHAPWKTASPDRRPWHHKAD